jgi:hypothetical protein
MDPELVLVDFVVRHLVDHPSDIKIEKKIDDQGILLKLTVAEEDLGRVIGKQGVIANSLRALLHALGARNNTKYNLLILQPEKIND